MTTRAPRGDTQRVPGPRSRELARRLRLVESRNITFLSDEFPIFWASAAGCTIRDVDGNDYLDLTGAFAVASLGHTSPAIRRALLRQSQKMWHGMGDIHPNEVKVLLLERLVKIVPGAFDVSILSSSGAEAVESALKTALLSTGKAGVLSFDGAYHGLTYGALLATHRSDFRHPFERQLAHGSFFAKFPDPRRGISAEESLASAEKAFHQAKREKVPIGAIIVEAIQGRGGVRYGGGAFLRGLRRLADKHHALLIADEIFTGFGRTGKLFAFQHSGITPDLLCIGKALGNGFPISACIGSKKVMQAWMPSKGEAIHTSTFLGNPLGCAMALASLDEMQRQNLVERSATIGAQWLSELKESLGSNPLVRDIRGYGLMIGLELAHPRAASRVVVDCLREGLLVLSGGADRNVITLTPPLVIKNGDLRKATVILKKVLSFL